MSQALERASMDDGEPFASFEAVLHPDPDASTPTHRVEASSATLTKFESLVESAGGAVLGEVDIIDGLTFIPLLLPPSAAASVAQFNPLRSLTPMPEMSLLDVDAGNSPNSVAAPNNAHDRPLPKVLVFDGGVDNSGPIFKGLVSTVDLTGNGPVASYARHGSAITAAVIYGDVASRGSLGEPAAQVSHYQVFPSPVPQQATEYPWILKQIRETIESTDAKIVNLSLGPKVPIDDGEPHRWTAVLDKLAYDRGILFVTAAGNNGAHATAGLERVRVPADMVNGLAVGAADSPANSKSWDAADYSARGPGRPGSRIQPSVICYGGTPQRGFGRLRPDGSIHHDDHGTSYAAPQVTDIMARLSRELGGRADPPTLRALAVHFAERETHHSQTKVGHGRLTEAVIDRFTCAPYEATIVYHGIIGRTEVRAFPLPFPSAFGKGLIDLSWTVAYSTATDATEAGDYTNAGLEAVFRPHKDKRTMTLEKPDKTTSSHVVNVVSDGAEIDARLAQGWNLPKAATTRSPKERRLFEGDLRELGKWETIAHYRDTINASSMSSPQIDINHLSREGGRITRGSDDIEFSLVVTMSSKAHKPLYDLVVNEFDLLVPLPVVAEATASASARATVSE